MARVTLRLPDGVHKELVARARRSRTSLNQMMVDILSDALGCGKETASGETLKERETRLLREALGARAIRINPDDFGPFESGEWGLLDRDALFAAMPHLDPPLSATLIEERRESRY